MSRPEAYGGSGPTLMAVGWSQASIAVILCILRLYGASKKAGYIRWDFTWVAAATFTGIASHACLNVSISYGMGNHVSALLLPEIFEALRWVWISIFVGTVAVIFAKFAIIALLLQVQGPNAKKRAWFLWFVGFWVAVAAIGQIFLSLLQCSPIARLWNPTIAGSCSIRPIAANWSYFQGAIAVSSDVILALWPISIVYNLQTTRKVKLGFCALMAGGILPAIASVYRTTLLHGVGISNDITWDFGYFMIWPTTELWSVIILGSIPPLRPLFLRFFGKVHSSLSNSKSRTNTGLSGRGNKFDTAESDESGPPVPLKTFGGSPRYGAGGKKNPYMESRSLGVLSGTSSEEELASPQDPGGIYVSKGYAVKDVERGDPEYEDGRHWHR